jgi:hypothetical protein
MPQASLTGPQLPILWILPVEPHHLCLPEAAELHYRYNMEATEALLRSLPPAAKITATNLMAQLSAKLNRSATITELNRGLNVFRSSIDEEIRTKGCNPDKEEKNTGKKPFKGTVSRDFRPSVFFRQSIPPTLSERISYITRLNG